MSTPRLQGQQPLYNSSSKQCLDSIAFSLQTYKLKQFDKLPVKVKKGIAEVHLEPTKADPGKIKLYMNDGNQELTGRP